MTVKIYGAFRSGTNYLKTLLELNYDVVVASGRGGFKHAPVPAMFGEEGWQKPQTHSLGAVKDPWAWLPSLWRYISGPGSKNVISGANWDDFLHSPLTVFDGAYEGFPRMWYRTPVDYWLTMAVSMSSACDRVVRYEDALEAPADLCDDLAAAFDLAATTGELLVPTMETQRMSDRARSSMEDYVTSEPFDRSYYDDRRYLDAYSAEQRRTVSAQLHDDIVTVLGYSNTL